MATGPATLTAIVEGSPDASTDHGCRPSTSMEERRLTSTPTSRRTVWTPEAVRGLGMTTNVETAGAILGIGRTKAYDLAKRGAFPAKVLRIGSRYVVSVHALIALLES
jgi:hypothetical protein